MSALLAQAVDLSSSNTTLVVVVGVIAILAVAIAMVFRGQVLAANDGTENMKTIASAVQEGASAYLNRQFRTLSIFAVVAFLLLFLLPAHSDGDNQTTLKIFRITQLTKVFEIHPDVASAI